MIFMPLIHTDKTSHLNGLHFLQRERRKKPGAEKTPHLVGEHDLHSTTVKGFTGHQGRAFCRQSGFILMHQPNQHLQELSLTNDSKKLPEKTGLSWLSHTYNRLGSDP